MTNNIINLENLDSVDDEVRKQWEEMLDSLKARKINLAGFIQSTENPQEVQVILSFKDRRDAILMLFKAETLLRDFSAQQIPQNTGLLGEGIDYELDPDDDDF